MVPNEILEALVKIRLPGQARQVLDLIMRKTFGFNKSEDRISLSQFAKGTGIGKTHVARAINRLISMNVITKIGNRAGTFYKLNTDVVLWNALPISVDSTKNGNTLTKIGNKAVPKMVHTKYKSKDNTTKDTIKGIPDSQYRIQVLRISNSYFEELRKGYPNLDHYQELINADLYRLANPKKGKRNDHLFLRNWFSNAVKFRDNAAAKANRTPSDSKNDENRRKLEDKYARFD
jgi:phage replication O-like protein O